MKVFVVTYIVPPNKSYICQQFSLFLLQEPWIEAKKIYFVLYTALWEYPNVQKDSHPIRVSWDIDIGFAAAAPAAQEK